MNWILEPGSAPINIKSVVDVDNSVTISWDSPEFPNGQLKVRARNKPDQMFLEIQNLSY